MPKVYEPADLGRLKRAYDELEDKESPEEILELLGWYRPVKASEGAKSRIDKSKVKELLEQGLDLDQIAKFKAVKGLKDASHKTFIIETLIDIGQDIAYAVWDFLSWRKVKTSLTIVGSIGAGAGIGALLGTLVFPGLGTLIGGAIGGAITTGLAAVGGVIGTSVLGAFLGSIIGKKTSDALFKHEKRFQPSRRFTRKIKSKFSINTSTVDMMNGYLWNRERAVSSKTMKKYYKKLRNETIKKAKPEAMEQLGYFFIQELRLLELERQRQPSNLELLSEIDAVKHILKKMANAKLSDDLKLQIKSQLKDYKDRELNGKPLPDEHFKKLRKAVAVEQKSERSLTTEMDDLEKEAKEEKKAKKKRSADLDTATGDLSRTVSGLSPVRSPSMLFSKETTENTDVSGAASRPLNLETVARALTRSFVDSLAAQGYVIEQSAAEWSDPLQYSYKIQGTSFKMDMRTASDMGLGNISVAQKELISRNKENTALLIAQQALQYSQQTGQTEFEVISNKDREIAIQISAALLKVGLKPKLDVKEYSLEEQRLIMTDAEKLVKKQSARLTPFPNQSSGG
ncbi:hypothetical protein CC99x_002785 [Candidatus Berkiella cookevillensis]|uniref:Uncharacterized protein n=1 Tax=Candidatus Berkiella cookevillensis TaxID=437022 RepID=A0A0Q9YDK5_9GAMM|nr:hypothetical protein [Candidatus Berkiella cookevillensis]MCS5707824.1 hypothetical protein [Candidatus Berkiella cookevillensis]